jgi:hypothetical protein
MARTKMTLGRSGGSLHGTRSMVGDGSGSGGLETKDAWLSQQDHWADEKETFLAEEERAKLYFPLK